MSGLLEFLYRPRLRHILFLILLFSGIIPLAVSSFLLIRQNTDILRTQEKSYLARSAEHLSLDLGGFVAESRGRLGQLGDSILAPPGARQLRGRLGESWITDRVNTFLLANPHIMTLRLMDMEGVGPQFTAAPLSEQALLPLQEAFQRAAESGQTAYEFVGRLNDSATTMAIATVVEAGSGDRMIVEALLEVEPMESFFAREAKDDVGVFLLDSSGAILWSLGSNALMDSTLEQSDIAREAAGLPGTQTAEYSLEVDGETVQMLARVSPVREAGWGVLVQKPAARAFQSVQLMMLKTVLSTLVLLVLALVGAVVVARRLSHPIQELTRTSHEIALGNFGNRVEVSGPGAELAQLATDFNRMSAQVQASVESLREAARQDRELFIGSMRAFVAAIDAKDPYTRGHSERVAAHSRTIAKRLGLPDDDQHVIWVGALLHDVGKIGIDDRVLKKGGVLSDAEYEQMKMHPVIGAQIMSRIQRLEAMIPAIRWHHENWAGAGYPDGLEGETIPLMARIVAVADTFDAITTNRPYQKAYEASFAVQRVKELSGKRFDVRVVAAFLQAFDEGEIQLRKTASALVSDAGAAAPA